METTTKTVITVENIVHATVEKVWEYWTSPAHIIKWNNASDDWHTTKAENEQKEGENYSSRMKEKDGSGGCDCGSVYDAVRTNEYIGYTMGDGRKVTVSFTANGNTTKVVERFEAETTNSIELQQGGWQAILDNFKKYTEAN